MTSPQGGPPPPARPTPAKGPAAFRTISEVSAELGVAQHVLRFWETRFAFIRPTKRAGGRRFYRPQDLDMLRGVRSLLQEEGYTIKGVQKLHREQGLKRLLAAAGVGAAAADLLAAEVEASDPEVEAAPSLPSAATTSQGGDDPRTGDLFATAAPGKPEEPPSTTGPSPRPSRPILDATARARLADVLGDLETTKAEIDALLREA